MHIGGILAMTENGMSRFFYKLGDKKQLQVILFEVDQLEEE